MPYQRFQLSRKQGWRLPENTVVVSRPSKWGNPFVMGKPGRVGMMFHGALTQEQAANEYAVWATMNPKIVSEAIRELRGKNLACWCKDGTPCHADTLLMIANG